MGVGAMAKPARQEPLRCRLGLHRWTTSGEHKVFTCFRCEKQRPAGATLLRCRLGRHRWTMVHIDDGDSHRQCLFCRKRQKLHEQWEAPGGGGIG